MSAAVHKIESFCKGCVAVAVITIATASFATLVWVMLI
jgi:hypothetical protein